MMASLYYYEQNPSGFCFLVQIKAFVIQTSLGLQNLNMKGKTKIILVVVVEWSHRPWKNERDLISLFPVLVVLFTHDLQHMTIAKSVRRCIARGSLVWNWIDIGKYFLFWFGSR